MLNRMSFNSQFLHTFSTLFQFLIKIHSIFTQVFYQYDLKCSLTEKVHLNVFRYFCAYHDGTLVIIIILKNFDSNSNIKKFGLQVSFYFWSVVKTEKNNIFDKIVPSFNTVIKKQFIEKQK